MIDRLNPTELPLELREQIRIDVSKYATALVLYNQLIGSGTFISWDGKYGLLTAGHVINNPDSSRFSITSSNEGPKLLQLMIAEYPHALTLRSNILEYVTLGEPDSAEFGPDVGVIIIPDCPELQQIKAKKSFWRIDFDSGRRIATALSNSGLTLFIGNPDEKFAKEPVPKGGFSHAVQARGLVGITQQKRYFEINDLDYFEVQSLRSSTTGALQDYGGMSGSGFWRIPLQNGSGGTLEDLRYNIVLAGTLFWQGAEEDGVRNLRAHGPKTIYDVLLRKLRAHSNS